MNEEEAAAEANKNYLDFFVFYRFADKLEYTL